VRILVADDNVDAADSLALVLELRGHEVRAAFNGGEAVRLAQEWPPDAAILDLNCPSRDLI
jgi:CheY-like chemotaxis protein